MSQVNFTKMSAAGNDFIIIDCRKKVLNFSKDQIAKICKRNNIGCDQLIILKEPISRLAEIFMLIFNSDGSESSACGNATRCVALMLMKESNSNKITIQTKAGYLKSFKNNDLVEVNMGKAKYSWQDIPLTYEIEDEICLENLKFNAVNIGNPHIVTFLEHPLNDNEFFRLGPKLENNNLFPKKTNIEFVTKISDEQLQVRVWERGVGETLSCGSGACAVAAIAFKNKIISSKKVKISFKGGDIFISLNSEKEIIMSGDAIKIFEGLIDEEFL
jgi:diaminopimelate epimerase